MPEELLVTAAGLRVCPGLRAAPLCAVSFTNSLIDNSLECVFPFLATSVPMSPFDISHLWSKDWGLSEKGARWRGRSSSLTERGGLAAFVCARYSSHALNIQSVIREGKEPSMEIFLL